MEFDALLEYNFFLYSFRMHIALVQHCLQQNYLVAIKMGFSCLSVFVFIPACGLIRALGDPTVGQLNCLIYQKANTVLLGEQVDWAYF